MKDILECTVIILPTEKHAVGRLCMLDIPKLLSIVQENSMLSNNPDNQAWKPYHLYLVSDREIEDNQWYLREGRYLLNCRDQKEAQAAKHNHVDYPFNRLGVKIEATTDPSLGLPLIPQSFIEEYVQKQGKIDKVRIKLNPFGEYQASGAWHKDYQLDEVIILPIKDSWNRAEVKDTYKAWKACIELTLQGKLEYTDFDEWLDKNY